MKIYRDTKGNWHRDAKSAGAGAIGIVFDNKTKDGILDLLARLGPVTLNPPKDEAEGQLERNEASPPKPTFRPGERTRVWYKSQDGSPPQFVGIGFGPTEEEAIADVASRLMTHR